MPVRATLLVAVLVVLATGCGGGGGNPLSHDAYVQQANAVCRTVSKQEKALTAPSSLAGIPDYVSRALPVVDDAIGQLHELRPPADIEATVNEWLASLDESRGLLSDLGKAASDNDATKVQAIGAQATTVTAKSHSLAGSVGLADCANA